MSKVIRDKFGTKLKYPNRTCKDCKEFPCFTGIENCKCDFAKYGCINYFEKYDTV